MKLSGEISEANGTVEGKFQHGDSVHFEVGLGLWDPAMLMYAVCTWRIIPFTKWLGSPPFISHEVRPFGRAPTLLRGLTSHGY